MLLIRKASYLASITFVIFIKVSTSWVLFQKTSSATFPTHLYQQQSSIQHALSIVPPDETWDAIQRVRYLAQDSTYSTWPPCIRLFHPLAVDENSTALDIANLIEKYNITSFEVVLDSWSIIPNAEAMEVDWRKQQESMGDGEHHYYQVELSSEETKVEQLIAKEEEKGLVRHIERQKRQGKALMQKHDRGRPGSLTKRELLEQQAKKYQEFNGPCVICLEPNSESINKISTLRALLRNEVLGHSARYSPSSSISNTYPKVDSDFRPIVPIAGFETVSEAIPIARKLRSRWKPLAFMVNDLHLMSVINSDTEDQGIHTEQHRAGSTFWKSSSIKALKNDGQFGCDALIALVGHEIVINETESQELANLVCQQGIAGGQDELALVEEEGDFDEENSSISLERWLAEDDLDDGTVVVIGRTHFFTGEMRHYLGMPATSTFDQRVKVPKESMWKTETENADM